MTIRRAVPHASLTDAPAAKLSRAKFTAASAAPGSPGSVRPVHSRTISAMTSSAVRNWPSVPEDPLGVTSQASQFGHPRSQGPSTLNTVAP